MNLIFVVALGEVWPFNVLQWTVSLGAQRIRTACNVRMSVISFWKMDADIIAILIRRFSYLAHLTT